ncbi:MAG: DNA-deoxyinosine glycosylase [Candidatus Sedimenticola sp. (ex Thyasira tokunagai)]
MDRKIKSFPPIVDSSACTLVLGTMPGVESLRANQYYANSRNSFWKIMARLYGFTESSTYQEKKESLNTNRIAVWDVMHTCVRSGSLDSNIRQETIKVNDFISFFRDYPKITKICFNGGKAETEFKRKVFPTLSANLKDIICIRLPSTSPAMAQKTFEEKYTEWSRALKST